jgi:hypothetical protein
MCRRQSGGAFLTLVQFPIGSFIWIEGKPTRSRSSPQVERGFCSQCGSSLAFHEAGLDDRVEVTLGSLDRPADVRPDDHVGSESQLPWLKIDDDLPRFAQMSSAAPKPALDNESIFRSSEVSAVPLPRPTTRYDGILRVAGRGSGLVPYDRKML